MTGTPWRRGRSVDGGIDEVPVPGAGRLFLCGKHFIGPDPERVVAAVGADIVVALNQEHELSARYPDYVAWLRADPIDRWWWPVPDLGAPTLDRFTELVARIDGRLRAGATLVVHCGAGIGRAGTVAAGVLVHGGTPVDDAIAIVAAARPLAGPEAGSQREVLDDLRTQGTT